MTGPDRGGTVPGAFFFGCARGVWGERHAGHHLYEPGGRKVHWDDPLANGHGIGPFGKVDAALAPRPRGRYSEAPQGHAELHHRDGWTALAFWDRTGDSHPNSNSTFIFDAELDFAGALAAARSAFPELFDRFDFEVVPYG